MSSSRYDVVVLGTGGMGSAALFHLAQRGVKVCGFDRFGIAHDRGSSHGDSRVIRRAYYEHPDYVPLLEQAYELWSALGDGLMEKTGLVVAGESGSEVMRGQAACYARHDLPHEKWSAAETRSRYPQFSIPDSMEAFFDPDGGYLLVEKCVETHIRRAIEMDAEFFSDEPVESWEIDGEGIRVRTANREVFADKLVITSGSSKGSNK